MNKSPSLLYKSTGDKNVTSGVTKMSPQTRRERAVQLLGPSAGAMFGKAWADLIADTQIGNAAFRLLMFLGARAYRSTYVELGYEQAAEVISCSRRQAIRVLLELEQADLISVVREHNRRNVYQLSPEYFGTVGQPDKPEISPPRICLRCHRPRRALARTGWCRGCTEAVELPRLVSEARLALGSSATAKEIAAHLKLGRLAAKIEKIMEMAIKAKSA